MIQEKQEEKEMLHSTRFTRMVKMVILTEQAFQHVFQKYHRKGVHNLEQHVQHDFLPKFYHTKSSKFHDSRFCCTEILFLHKEGMVRMLES